MRRREKCLLLVIVLASQFIFPSPAYADNCSGLSDCYGTILAAILVVLGLILLVAAIWYFWPLIARFALSLALRARILSSVGSGVGRILSRSFGRMIGRRTALQIARAGGRHAGTLRNYAGRAPNQIARAIRSYRSQVAEHLRYIRNPASKVPNWTQLSRQEQTGLLRKWANDAQRNGELANLLEDLLRSVSGGQ